MRVQAPHQSFELDQRKRRGLLLPYAVHAPHAVHENFELFVVRGRGDAAHGVRLADGGVVPLNGGYFLTGFGQVGDEVHERIDRGGQRLETLAGALGPEPLQVGGVRPGRIGRAGQSGLDVAGGRAGVMGEAVTDGMQGECVRFFRVAYI